MPQLTDGHKSNVKTLDSSQISAVDDTTMHQEEKDGEPNCYLLLPWNDIRLVVDSINDDND